MNEITETDVLRRKNAALETELQRAEARYALLDAQTQAFRADSQSNYLWVAGRLYEMQEENRRLRVLLNGLPKHLEREAATRAGYDRAAVETRMRDAFENRGLPEQYDSIKRILDEVYSIYS